MMRSAISPEHLPTRLPADAVGVLRAIGEKYFAPLMERPEARAFWWPRFQRIARWFAEWEPRAAATSTLSPPRSGAKSRSRSTMSVLYAHRPRRPHRAAPDGSYAILDYKTGQPPTGKQVRMGLSPQLTLEAAILREGGFADIAAGGSIAELAYVRLSGNKPPGEHKTLESKIKHGDTPHRLTRPPTTRGRKLEALIRTFEDENQPYTSLNLSMWTARYGDYDDLARVKEWSAAGGLALEEW